MKRYTCACILFTQFATLMLFHVAGSYTRPLTRKSGCAQSTWCVPVLLHVASCGHMHSAFTGLADSCLPNSVQTDKLAVLKAKQVKAAGTMRIAPFPYVEIMNFMPPWAKSGSKPVIGNQRPDMVRWVASFQDMALAAAATEVWHS